MGTPLKIARSLLALTTVAAALAVPACNGPEGQGSVKMPTVKAKGEPSENPAPPPKKGPGGKPVVKGNTPGKPIGVDARSGKAR
jgi:hypothetical protein